ncbi:hypothetical protein OHA25_13695 [Nonomuraea sp. NBC_00507]|uniref:hypothetical protein n=1 Tax=Nonomuraea sp. NBC_00507 TaxID=2976002 RepID=UPI002E17E7BE
MIDENPPPEDSEEDQPGAEEESEPAPTREERQTPSGLQRLGVGLILITVLGITADLMGIASFDISDVWFLKGAPSPGNAEGGSPASIGEWLPNLWAGLLQIRAEAPGWFVGLALSFAVLTALGPRSVWRILRALAPLGVLLSLGWLLLPWIERWPIWSWWSANWPNLEGIVAFGALLFVALLAFAAFGASVGADEEGSLPLYLGGVVLWISAFLGALAMVAWWDGLPWYLKGMQVVECIVIAILGYASIRGILGGGL